MAEEYLEMEHFSKNRDLYLTSNDKQNSNLGQSTNLRMGRTKLVPPMSNGFRISRISISKLYIHTTDLEQN